MSDIWKDAPDDAQAYMPESDEWLEGYWKRKGDVNYFWARHAGSGGVWQSSYAKPFGHPSLVMRPEVDKAWNGHGLPPVGTVCEYYVDEDDWRQCEVVAHKDGYAVIWLNAAHVFSSRACGLLRPIRTPEQLAAEEREKAILEIYQTITISRAQAEAIYDAGYRKQENQK